MALTTLAALLISCGGNSDQPLDDTAGDTGSLDTADTADTGGAAEGNAYQEAACAINGQADDSLVLAAAENEAGTSVMVPDGGTQAIGLKMPATGDGWMILEVADWMSTVHLFTDESVTYEVSGVGLSYDEGSTRETNPACPNSGMTDHVWEFHDWGSYVLQFADSSPDSIWLYVAKEE